MLTVRDAQLNRFRQNAARQFARRVVDFVLASQPDRIEGRSIDSLCDLAELGIVRARALGLRHSSFIGLFAVLTLTVGPAFDSEPECRGILEDFILPPDARMQRLLASDSGVPWAELRERCYRRPG